MKRAEYARWKTHQKGKGFSLTELVIVIIIIAILALAVFAGGSSAIKKAKISRATSDLHNFDVALQTYMFSNRDPVKLTVLSPKEDFNKVVDGLNPFLPMGYTLKSVTLPTSGNIFSTLSFLNVYESEKKDPWDNPYYFLIDPTARNAGETEYYFIVMSAGQNAQANVGGPLDKDDIYLLCEYNNGTVTTNVYNMSTDTKDLTGSPLTRGETSLISSTNGSSPRNTGKAAKDIAHIHTTGKLRPTPHRHVHHQATRRHGASSAEKLTNRPFQRMGIHGALLSPSRQHVQTLALCQEPARFAAKKLIQ